MDRRDPERTMDWILSVSHDHLISHQPSQPIHECFLVSSLLISNPSFALSNYSSLSRVWMSIPRINHFLGIPKGFLFPFCSFHSIKAFKAKLVRAWSCLRPLPDFIGRTHYAKRRNYILHSVFWKSSKQLPLHTPFHWQLSEGSSWVTGLCPLFPAFHQVSFFSCGGEKGCD